MITKGLLVHLLHEKQMFETEFKAFIKDKKFPLDERWDLFKFACENNLFVKIESSYSHIRILESNHNSNWYDTFYIERYTTVEFTNIVEEVSETLEEILEYPDYSEDSRDYYPIRTREELVELKEEILATGYSGFVYDW
jgi:hypothetical protein